MPPRPPAVPCALLLVAGCVADVADADGDGFIGLLDCDDHDAAIHPGAAESVCDPRDEDCVGVGIVHPFVLDGVEMDGPQDALDASTDGSAVQVCPGRCRESGTFDGTGSRSFVSWTGDAADTILDGADVDRILGVHSGLRVSVQNLTITHGNAKRDGYCWVAGDGGATPSDGAPLELVGDVFSYNVACCTGGAVDIDLEVPSAGPVSIEDSTFIGNDSRACAGGLSVEGGVLANSLVTVIRRSRFEDNHADTEGWAALGISGESV